MSASVISPSGMTMGDYSTFDTFLLVAIPFFFYSFFYTFFKGLNLFSLGVKISNYLINFDSKGLVVGLEITS